jgi:2-dehydro-3-deoxygalactonokinase
VSRTEAPAVAAVDWGTSQLRIWLLDRQGAVLGERRSDDGMLATPKDGFAAVLEGHLAALQAPDELPVIICGMAGARQGWIEAPYVAVPAPLPAVLSQAVAVAGAPRRVAIVPGLCQRDAAAPDVLRGEETQLAGVAPLSVPGRHLACLPGTHSKWVLIEDGVVQGFGTWLTGELFGLLAGQSILRHAVGGAGAHVSAERSAFGEWLRRAIADPGALSAALFRIRAATLLLDLGPEDAAAALSGLLIGTEIGAATARFGRPGEAVTLIASGTLGALYGTGLALAGLSVELADAETAVREGLLAAARLRYFNEPRDRLP